jgi:uncharacterized membrane protein
MVYTIFSKHNQITPEEYMKLPSFNISFLVPPEKVDRRRHAIRSFKAKADAKRSFTEKIADFLTAKLGSIAFLISNVACFVGWILWNTGKIPGLEPIDPFPFGLLTMVVSLEAIVLAIIVLISQNREARVNELRDEVDLQINMVTEEELTKLIKLVVTMLETQGVKAADDPELKRLLETSNDQIERELEKELKNN